jgi:hypothetical protein
MAEAIKSDDELRRLFGEISNRGPVGPTRRGRLDEPHRPAEHRCALATVTEGLPVGCLLAAETNQGGQAWIAGLW